MKLGGLKSFVESRRSILVCLLLAAATLAVYWQVAGFEFTNYDDDQMISDNPAFLNGLTPQGLWWALTTSWYEYWHPVTWWSHMLDCQLFELRAGRHHLVSLGFHVANTLLLFVVLRRMTGGRQGRQNAECRMQNSRAFWCSAMVAALFALHPLHVESVAWIAERKDVLSAFFFLLTLWAYSRYVEGLDSKVLSPKSKVQGPDLTQSRREPQRVAESNVSLRSSAFLCVSALRIGSPRFWSWTAVAMFACGLMSKPMVVTLPFVLLLLDYWPLRRMQNAECGMRSAESALQRHASRITNHESRITPPASRFHPSSFILHPLLLEKLPFFALSVASCLITYFGVKAGGNMLSVEKVPWGLRLANVPVSYVRYLWKMIWPTDLVVLYPMPGHWAWWQVGGAVVVLVLISLWAVLRARSAPYWIVGWLLFLGMLLPTIGLVQVGRHALADRYTYLPSIGIFIAVVWAVAEWAGGQPQMDTDGHK